MNILHVMKSIFSAIFTAGLVVFTVHGQEAQGEADIARFKERVQALENQDASTLALADEIITSYKNYAHQKNFPVFETTVTQGHPELVYLAIEHLFGDRILSEGSKALALLKTKVNAEWLIDRFGYECLFTASGWNESSQFVHNAALMEMERSICNILDLKLELERDKRVPLEVFRAALGPSTHEGVSPTEAKRLKLVAMLDSVNNPTEPTQASLPKPVPTAVPKITNSTAWWKWLLGGLGVVLSLQFLWRKKSS